MRWICVIGLWFLWIGTLTAQGFPVVITEILPDPIPSVGLPSEEFIELTNVSGQRVDLSGWSISNGRTKGRIPAGTIIEADSIILFCNTRAVAEYVRYGRTISLSPFPTLTNTGDTIVLYDKKNEVVFAVTYNENSFEPGKKDGGYSLEMISPAYACSILGNWKASADISGGTPGKPNSHDPSAAHLLPPFSLIHGYTISPSTIRLVFNDAVDKTLAMKAALFQMNNDISIVHSSAMPPLFNEVQLELSQNLQAGNLYEIQAGSLASCSGSLPIRGSVKTGLPTSAGEGIVINEIMTDPSPDGCDFIELYNKGDKIIDLGKIRIANKNSFGEPASIRQVSTSPHYLLPQQYIVLATDPAWIQQHYHVKEVENLLPMNSLPSFPNNKGWILLLNADSSIIDELHYDDSWHHELLKLRENVSLERIDPNGITQDSSNWNSAAMHAGYGTPGYLNSQFLNGDNENYISIEQSLFSPDGDGISDECKINYRFKEHGNVCTIRIFDINGTLKRALVNNGICGTSGYFTWKGLDDSNNALPTGLYIVVVDYFTLSGKSKRRKFAVTLARR